MKKLLLTSALVLAVVAPAHAADECLLSMEALIPVMKHTSKNHKVSLNGREFKEMATMSNGARVLYEAGGCAHFAFSYKFDSIPGGIPKEPDDPFTLPLKLMSLVPYRDQFDGEVIIRALKAAQAEGRAVFDDKGTTSLPCGDATCSLTIGKEMISIDYDFAI